jgi:hypothetical protein
MNLALSKLKVKYRAIPAFFPKSEWHMKKVCLRKGDFRVLVLTKSMILERFLPADSLDLVVDR